MVAIPRASAVAAGTVSRVLPPRGSVPSPGPCPVRLRASAGSCPRLGTPRLRALRGTVPRGIVPSAVACPPRLRALAVACPRGTVPPSPSCPRGTVPPPPRLRAPFAFVPPLDSTCFSAYPPPRCHFLLHNLRFETKIGISAARGRAVVWVPRWGWRGCAGGGGVGSRVRGAVRLPVPNFFPCSTHVQRVLNRDATFCCTT